MVLLLTNNIILDIISFIILVIGAVKIAKFDFAHPYVWYSFVFMLYSVSYPILYLNNMTYDVYFYSKELMFSQWLALATFLLVVGPKKVDYSRLNLLKTKTITSKYILILTSIILIFTIIEISTGGYSHKSDIHSSGSFVVSLGFRAVLIFLLLYTINLTANAIRMKKLDLRLSLYVGSIIFFIVFFSGERDLLIRFFVIIFFVYYIFIKDSKLSKELILLGLLSLSLIPILKQYKYFGLTGEKIQSESNFLFSFLTSDFMSASKNMQILLLDETSEGKFKGATFLSAITRTFNLDKLLDLDIISSSQWYNQNYFGLNRSGQGFTIVGDGYVNFGFIGIVVLFVIIGFLLKFIYLQSNKGIYHFTFYILSIPIFMYAIRADLANILSPLIKQNLLTFILLWVVVQIIEGIPTSRNKNGETR